MNLTQASRRPWTHRFSGMLTLNILLLVGGVVLLFHADWTVDDREQLLTLGAGVGVLLAWGASTSCFAAVGLLWLWDGVAARRAQGDRA